MVYYQTSSDVALVMRRYSYHRCVDCWKKGVQNIEGKYCCVDHPEAETEEIYRLRVLLRQGDLNMWVTAFDEVAEAIMGVTVKKFSAFDDDGRKRVAGGVSGMKCYMTIEKTHGVYTNPGEREGKHITYTKHLPTRGQSFIHPTLAREDVFSTERMRGSAISEYVVSHTLGTYMLVQSSSPLLLPE